MVRPLQELLEREFDLKFYGHFSIQELRAMDAKKIDWFHGTLSRKLSDGNGQVEKE